MRCPGSTITRREPGPTVESCGRARRPIHRAPTTATVVEDDGPADGRAHRRHGRRGGSRPRAEVRGAHTAVARRGAQRQHRQAPDRSDHRSAAPRRAPAALLLPVARVDGRVRLERHRGPGPLRRDLGADAAARVVGRTPAWRSGLGLDHRRRSWPWPRSHCATPPRRACTRWSCAWCSPVISCSTTSYGAGATACCGWPASRSRPRRCSTRTTGRCGSSARCSWFWRGARCATGDEDVRRGARRALVALVVGGLLFVPWLPVMLYQSVAHRPLRGPGPSDRRASSPSRSATSVAVGSATPTSSARCSPCCSCSGCSVGAWRAIASIWSCARPASSDTKPESRPSRSVWVRPRPTWRRARTRRDTPRCSSRCSS